MCQGWRKNHPGEGSVLAVKAAAVKAAVVKAAVVTQQWPGECVLLSNSCIISAYPSPTGWAEPASRQDRWCATRENHPARERFRAANQRNRLK